MVFYVFCFLFKIGIIDKGIRTKKPYKKLALIDLVLEGSSVEILNTSESGDVTVRPAYFIVTLI